MDDERKKLSGDEKMAIAGRVILGIVALFVAIHLADQMIRGTVEDRFHLVSADRVGEPVKFWLYSAVWAFFISVLAWGAIRGFDQKK